MRHDVIYDIETYPNVFTFAAEHAYLPLTWEFEITPWKNQSKELIEFLIYLKNINARLVGFNSLGFDYPVLHTLIRQGYSDAETLYNKAQAIISSQDNEDRWAHQVKVSDRFVEQIDLFKIHHFDNMARATSLKMLEFNMRSDNIEDLPFPVGTVLDQEQTAELKRYNAHDVSETKKFFFETTGMIEFREEMTQKYNRDFMNHNDTKIGKDYFIMKLEESGIPCYDFGSNGRTMRQTKRSQINLGEAVLPWIKFEQPEFTRIIEWFRNQTITETKGVFKDIVATVHGFEFVFGLGGIHGSLHSEIIDADDEYAIVDLDVASYYPNLAIANEFYPAHLGKEFCDIYKNLYDQRRGYKKGTVENAMLKLALNGVYGDSNNRFSPFYDPLYTMKITLNGQLLLCLLAENLMKIDNLTLIQVNTDGLTVKIPRVAIPQLEQVWHWWEGITGLTLEDAYYKTMFIRDVNNYIAVYENGGVKRKGAYEYVLGWHQNHSAIVVPKVAEKVLVEGAPIRETLEKWPEIMDFMCRTKVPRSSYLAIEHDGESSQLQNITRYLVTDSGGALFKWMPPLKKKPDEWRKIGVESGWTVTPCNNLDDLNNTTIDINYDYYQLEVEKLCLGLA